MTALAAGGIRLGVGRVWYTAVVLSPLLVRTGGLPGAVRLGAAP